MKVLILFSSSSIGGAEVSLTHLAQDDTYLLATIKGEGTWSAFARSHNFEPIIFGSNYSRVVDALLFWMPYLRLKWYLKKNSIDIIYVCGIKTTFWLRLFKVFMPNFKIVQGIRSNLRSQNLRDRFFRFMERHFSEESEFYISNSRAASTVLINQCKIKKNKIKVIHNGLGSLNNYPIIPFAEKKDTICIISNFLPDKGHIEFLKVIQIVLKTKPNAKFYFLGRDDMNGKVQAAITKHNLEDNIVIEGYVKDVRAFVKNIKVSALPSFSEGCPTSILEAMSVGTPAIGYNIDGIPELIENDKQGYVIPCFDNDIFAQSILSLLDDSKKYEEFQTAGLLRIQSDFTLEQMSARHYKVWETIMRNPSL